MAHPHHATSEVQLDKELNRRSEPIHRLLEPGYTRIRLLRILPTPQGSLIRGELLEYSLDKEIIYTALSYEWGEARYDHQVIKILINDRPFWIRTSLWGFLDRARQRPKIYQRLFWIDVICINQASKDDDFVNEKSHQVNMMGKIYSKAELVICWLGEADAYVRPFLLYLEEYPFSKVHTKADERALRGLRYILNVSYWTRMWIVQEVVLANYVSLVCETSSFSWHAILDLWNDNTATLENWGKAKQIIQWSSHERCKKRQLDLPSQSAFLFDILETFQHQECTVPLDKIYGLLGLIDRKVLMPDYNLTVEQLFQQVLEVSDDYLKNEVDTYFKGSNPWKDKSTSEHRQRTERFLRRYLGLAPR